MVMMRILRYQEADVPVRSSKPPEKTTTFLPSPYEGEAVCRECGFPVAAEHVPMFERCPRCLKRVDGKGARAMTIKRTETDEQITVVEWCEAMRIPVAHIPNEGKRSPVAGRIMKRMGLRKGFPDLFVPLPKGGFHGLFVEMKAKWGKTTKEQEEWLSLLNSNGYAVCVAVGANEGIEKIKRYVRLQTYEEREEQKDERS